MIIINFKNYKFGKESLNLARKIEKYLPNAIAAVSAVDINLIYEKTKLRVFAQHVDAQESNRATGFILPENVKKAGAVGTLLNHSEHRISLNEIGKTLIRCKKMRLKAVVCSSSLKEVKNILRLKPKLYAIAFEDSKLVGTGKSITEYKTDDVVKFVEIMKGRGIIALCGAGISTAHDVREAYRLGCEGVLIASAIANVNLKKAEILLKELRNYNENS